jgi:hypothetical protein
MIRIRRKGLQLHFPSSYGNPRLEPTERERQDALFLLPRFGRGIDAEIGLWPLRPSGKKKRWRGVAVARVRRAPDDPWPEDLERIEIEVVANASSRIYGEFRKVMEGEELQRFRDGDSRLFVFPVDGIRPGNNTVSLRALGVGGEISANVRSELEVPRPPGSGEAGPWLLVDRLARVGGTVTVLPALDGVIDGGSGRLIVGYGCLDPDARPGEGRLQDHAGERSVPVPVDWLDPPEITGDGNPVCGWLAGTVDPLPEPGLWRFEPPSILNSDPEERVPLEFRIDSVQPGPDHRVPVVDTVPRLHGTDDGQDDRHQPQRDPEQNDHGDQDDGDQQHSRHQEGQEDHHVEQHRLPGDG